MDHDPLTCAACGNFPGNPYWTEYALVLLLLASGFFLQRRIRPQKRVALRVCMMAGASITFVVFGSQFLPLAYMNEPALLVSLKAAAFTTVCVYFELVLSPRRDPIPQAIARECATSAARRPASACTARLPRSSD